MFNSALPGMWAVHELTEWEIWVIINELIIYITPEIGSIKCN